MKARMVTTASAALICLSLLATLSISERQASSFPELPGRRHLGVSEPLSPSREPQIAPLRPGALERPPPGTGFIPPPMDLSHLTGQSLPGGIRPPAWPQVHPFQRRGAGRGSHRSGPILAADPQRGCFPDLADSQAAQGTPERVITCE